MPFTSLGLGPKITRALREQGYVEPTPIQAKAIPAVLEGRDVIGVAQTGTGKTAAFVLPMLERLAAGPRRRRMRALVIAPTRELVVQTEENVRVYGRHLDLQYATVYGGVGEHPQVAALRRGVDLVVATPGRLLDLMARRHVDLTELAFVVLDEADRMLDMGFLPDIRRIMATLPANRQTLLFSATLSPEIEKIAAEFLRNPVTVQIGPRATPVVSVTQTVIEVSRDLKIDALLHLLTGAKFEMVLVFSRTKHGADKIARKLEASGIETATLHSNRTQGQRILALKRFRSGEVRVLVATDIAARGIDVDGISHVINYDFPPQPEDYVHRIGRTGRMLAIGDAISFVTPDDHVTLRQLEKFLGRGLPRTKLTLGPRPPRPPHAEGGLPHRGPGGAAGHRRPGGSGGPGGRTGNSGHGGPQARPAAHGQPSRRPGQSHGPARSAHPPASGNRPSGPHAPYAPRGPQPGRFNRSGGGR
jgi:ATP-dependent RNA helicase RhlE